MTLGRDEAKMLLRESYGRDIRDEGWEKGSKLWVEGLKFQININIKLDLM